METVADDSYQQAQAYFNAGNYRRCRDLVHDALATQPDDVELLKLAGRCSVELNTGDAVAYLQRVVRLDPGDAEAWHELGDALVDEGRLPEAVDALRQALRLSPDNATVLVDLGHILYAMGDRDGGVEALTQAVRAQPGNLATLRSLVEMHRKMGDVEDALAFADQIAELQPGDVLATLDQAELNASLGRYDEAVRAYGRLRQIDAQQDPDMDHEVYAYHGMIGIEMQRERWRRVLDLAVDATRVDRYGLTTDVLAFAVAQVFGAGDRPAPSRAEVEASLTAEAAEHRRRHTDALSL